MDKLDYLLIIISIAVVAAAYYGLEYFLKLIVKIKKYVKNIESINKLERVCAYMEKNIQDGLRLNEKLMEGIRNLDRMKEIVRDRELNLINMEDLCETNMNKANEQYDICKVDLANCRAKSAKIEKQLRKAEARIADLITKDSS